MIAALAIILAITGVVLIGAAIEIGALRRELKAERILSDSLRCDLDAVITSAPVVRGPGGRFVKRG